MATPVESVIAAIVWSCATMQASQLKAILQEPRWSSAHNARCATMPTAMPVLLSEAAYTNAMQNRSKKSLILLSDVEAEPRKGQVLPAPRTPKAARDHLSLWQGMETVTSMAPLKSKGIGWDRPSQLPLTNYGGHWSRG